jgi:predicted anti-sigma-YlaC factor YlaD
MNTENDFAGFACSDYEAFLEDYLEGSLEGSGARKLTEHLKTCAGCSQALLDASAASQWLHQVQATPDPGPGFAHLVMARIRTHESYGRASFWEPFVSLAWKFATTAALALVVMLAYASRGNTTVATANSTCAAVSVPSDVQDILVASESGVPATRSEMVRMVTESDNAEQ